MTAAVTDRPSIPTDPLGRPARRPLPQGAVKWARVYLDDKARPVESAFLVPVDADDRRTPHIRVGCPETVKVDGDRRPCTRDAFILPHEPVRFCPDHGAMLTAEQPKRAALPWAAMWHAVEKPARPAYLLAAEVAAGVAFEVNHLSPGWAALSGAAAAGGGYYVTRGYLTRRSVRHGSIDEGQQAGRRVDTIRRRARVGGYIGSAAGAWLTVAATVDPTSMAGKLVWAALPPLWALSSATWWRYLEAARNRPAPVEVPLFVPPTMTLDRDALSAAEASRLWAEHVAFADTKLDPATWQRTIAGWQAVVLATKPGALVNATDADTQKRTIARIAAAYNVRRAAITWIGEYDDSPNKALLLIQPNNPLSEGQVWAGPRSIDMTKGVAEVGRLITGEPMVERIYRYGWGAPSAISIGSTGGGKSVRARKKLVIERWATFPDPTTGKPRGAFISMIHDPKRLESFAEFKDAVHAYGVSRDDAHIMVDALIRECFRRYDSMGGRKWMDRKGRARTGGVAWSPLIHGPVISVYWDEFHELAADKEFVKKIERLARYQRACGMRAELLTHMATIGDTGSQALRALLAGGRATLFQTTSGLTGPLVTGGQLTGDPRTLPREPGMCYVCDGETASLVGRESWIPADDQAYDETLYDWLYDDDNQPIGYPAEIPPETVEAFGKEFMEWAAAGRRDGGRDTPSTAAGFLPADLRAEDALRQILFQAPRPLERAEIVKHPLWVQGGYSVTSTMTMVLRKGQDARPPWLIKRDIGKGAYELTAGIREQMSADSDEATEEDEAA